jgi:hypothetical protein
MVKILLGGLDFDVDTGSDGEDFELVDGVGSGAKDVEKAAYFNYKKLSSK